MTIRTTCSWRRKTFPAPPLKPLRNLIKKIAELTGLEISPDQTLAVSFPGPLTMRRINREFLNHDYLTDVIVFPYYREHEGESGEIAVDILISPDMAKQRSREIKNTTYADEMTLYLVHGILHAAGYCDKQADEIKRIRTAEQRILRELRKSFDFNKIFREK